MKTQITESQKETIKIFSDDIGNIKFLESDTVISADFTGTEHEMWGRQEFRTEEGKDATHRFCEFYCNHIQ